ncbi:28_t:CDS:2, partial [Racocetra persica]
DLQISSSSKSEYNSDNNLNDYVSTDNLKDNNILKSDLETGDNYEIYYDAKNAFGISNIQYAYGDPRTIRSIQKYPFLDIPVKKTYRSCLSVKVYEFSLATLDIEYISVNFEDQHYKTS